MAETVQVLCSSGAAVSEANVRIVHDIQDNKFSRKKHPDFEGRIEAVWESKIKEGCHLFDKPKFRFYRACTVEGVKGLEICLGYTSYKEFIGTNCAPYGKELLDIGMMDTVNHKDGSGHAYLANPLGVGSLVETMDSKFVFLRRSEKCAESPGLIDVPGGHPEPENIDYPRTSGDPTCGFAIREEIFESAKREIEDEVNIPHSSLGPFLLLGISFNKDTCYRPSLVFYARCNLTSDEVLEKYSQGTHPEKFESTKIIFITRQDLQKLYQEKSDTLYEKFTNPTKDGLYLLSIFMSWKSNSSSLQK